MTVGLLILINKAVKLIVSRQCNLFVENNFKSFSRGISFDNGAYLN